MAEAETQSTDQCKALTRSGDRCSREAGEDGFCHQHDEDDPIADEVKDSEESDVSKVDETEESDSTETSEPEEGSDVSETETTDPSDVDTSDVDPDDSGIEAVLAVRHTVESTASELIGRPLDSVTEIHPTDDGWRGVVEVVERSSIPDTQDILGRYEIELSEDGDVAGYRRMDRYRRDDTRERE